MIPLRGLVSLLAAAGALAAQNPETVRAQMEASIARQRASLAIQGGATALISQSVERQRAAAELQARTAAPLPAMPTVEPSAADAVVPFASGARFLSRLIAPCSGSLPLALAAYNAGPARVDAAGGVPDISETRDYVRSILESLSPVR